MPNTVHPCVYPSTEETTFTSHSLSGSAAGAVVVVVVVVGGDGSGLVVVDVLACGASEVAGRVSVVEVAISSASLGVHAAAMATITSSGPILDMEGEDTEAPEHHPDLAPKDQTRRGRGSGDRA